MPSTTAPRASPPRRRARYRPPEACPFWSPRTTKSTRFWSARCWRSLAIARPWRAAGTPFDRVLMDLHMPGMDGLEATRKIRAIEAEDGTPRTPIIALTANASAEDREESLAAGMDGFLVKPLDRERLAAALAPTDAAAFAA